MRKNIDLDQMLSPPEFAWEKIFKRSLLKQQLDSLRDVLSDGETAFFVGQSKKNEILALFIREAGFKAEAVPEKVEKMGYKDQLELLKLSGRYILSDDENFDKWEYYQIFNAYNALNFRNWVLTNPRKKISTWIRLKWAINMIKKALRKNYSFESRYQGSIEASRLRIEQQPQEKE